MPSKRSKKPKKKAVGAKRPAKAKKVTIPATRPRKAAVSTALIDVNVDPFRDIFNDPGVGPAQRGCGCTLTLKDDNKGSVRIPAGTNTIEVMKPTWITFRYPQVDYSPAGIAFSNPPCTLVKAGVQGRHHNEFPQDKIIMGNDNIAFYDKFIVNDARFKCYLIVQDSAGVLGIIDPPLIHQPQANFTAPGKGR